MFNHLNKLALMASPVLRRRQLPTVAFRLYRSSVVLCHEASSFFANTESEKAAKITKQVSKIQLLADDDDEDMEEMFIMGPALGKVEWGGPSRGGQRPEPTRFGDWERKGRCSDF